MTSPFKSILSSRTSGEVKPDSISVTVTELWVKRAPQVYMRAEFDLVSQQLPKDPAVSTNVFKAVHTGIAMRSPL